MEGLEKFQHSSRDVAEVEQVAPGTGPGYPGQPRPHDSGDPLDLSQHQIHSMGRTGGVELFQIVPQHLEVPVDGAERRTDLVREAAGGLLDQGRPLQSAIRS